ncbi:MAG: hypothetical protein L3J11_07880 [Draconibacterium sp.]|nr:hypothetical protein [Draconibacterium sp.]
MRLLRCLKCWATGTFIMGFPILFFYSEFNIENEIWKMLIDLFFVLSPVLLFLEPVFHRYHFFSKRIQFVVLSLFFIFAEIGSYYLPWDFTQLEYKGNWVSSTIIAAFAVIAAFVVSRILVPHKNLIIVQKEI